MLLLECKAFHTLLHWVIILHPKRYKGEKEWPDDPKDYDRKLWSYLYTIPNLGVSDDATNYIYYFLVIYLASKLTEPQAVVQDELFYNHA